MKLFSFVILFCTVSFNAKTQNGTDTGMSYLVRWIELEYEKKDIGTSLYFDNIEIIDLRYDTSNIGLLEGKLGSKIKVLNIQPSLTGAVIQFYKLNRTKYLLTNSGIDLVCIIKKFCLSDNFDANFSEEEKLNSVKYNVDEISGITGIFEFYARKNSIYTPLIRFDTTIRKFDKIKEYAKKYITNFLTSAFRALNTLDSNKIRASRQILEEVFKNNISKTFDLPILNQKPKKGLYYSFTDFRMNTPSVKEFTIERNNMGTYIQIKNRYGEDSLLTELWGYSDGERIYIHLTNNYYELYRSNNSFIFYGAKNFGVTQGLAFSNQLGSKYPKVRSVSTGLYIEKKYLQIDMNEGKIY